jgi:membrane protease YdiL (CAAX protease family)
MNTYLKYQIPIVQFFAFLALAGGAIILNSLVTSFFFKDINAVILDKNAVVSTAMVGKFKIAQVVSALISFVLPAFLFGYFSSPASLPYLGIQKHLSLTIILIGVILLFSIQPLIGYLGYENAHFNFGSMQKMVVQAEAMYNRLLKVFLQMHSVGDLLLNILLMALLPAIAEELFFRGALQKALLRLSNKPWLAIFVSAAVFGLLHGTFLKLVPIFTLGLLLGTVYYLTRNLWYTIIIHFINNSFALIAVYYGDQSELLKKISDDNISVPLYAAIISLIIVVGILFLIKRESDKKFPAAITSDENDYIA